LFIAIEGNIGAGKTTLSQMLAKEFECQLIMEQFTDNPFLPLFYHNPERYALPVELFFMTERHKQLQESLKQENLLASLYLSDYYFIKTLLFAQKNLNSDEFRLFKRLFEVLNATFKKPDLLVFLHRSVDNLLGNIKNRGRDYEADISGDYLSQIQDAYFDYFKTEQEVPILIIDIEGVEFWNNLHQYEEIKALIFKSYENGIHKVKIGISF
jgi:deoxyguanosine kinase